MSYFASQLQDGQPLSRTIFHLPSDSRRQTELKVPVRLPDGSGFDFCRQMRQAGVHQPILILTVQNEEIDKVLGLEMGADDYVCKPFSPRELLARIRNLLRLTGRRGREELPPEARMMRFQGWTLDTMERLLVSDQGVVQRLSGCEFLLLHALVARANRVLSRNQLAAVMHGREQEPHDRSIDVLVSRLRQLLGDSARDPRIIRTIYGRGYMLSGTVVRQ